MGNLLIAGVVRVPVSNNQYTVQQETVAQNGVTRYQLFYDATPLSYSDAVAHWQHDAEFRSYFVGLLQQSRYKAFRWENPAYFARLSTRPFEFVLVDYPSFATRKTDARTYREYFMFGRYVPRAVVNQLILQPELDALRLGGTKREVTVLFADIRGFTSFSEKMPPDQVVAELNSILKIMVECTFEHQGTLDKFIGDAILVLFNAPLDQTDHVQRAVRMAGRLFSKDKVSQTR
jgi:hypothetical protein